MRIRELSVAGFRGFSHETTFDLDADAIVIAGVNGSGKTSLLDALLWCLTGAVRRLSDAEEPLVSRYSPSGEARVEVVLSDDDGTAVSIARRFDGESHLSLREGEQTALRGAPAEARLLELLWPDSKAASDPREALARSLTRATYLQQDAVRDFVEANNEEERFQVIGELVGIGRIGEVQRQLESSRNRWSRATTQLTRDADALVAQRTALRDRLERLGPGDDEDDVSAQLDSWTESVRSVVPSAGPIRGELAVQWAERTLAELRQQEATVLNRLQGLERLREHMSARPPEAPNVAALAQELEAAEARAREASEGLEVEQQRIAEERRRQLEAADESDSRRLLAEAALRHLGPACPVCGQPIDEVQTRERLAAMAITATGTATDLPRDVGPAAEAVRLADSSLARARSALREAQQARARIADWEAELAELGQYAGLVEPLSTASINEQFSLNTRQLDALQSLRTRGEDLMLKLARLAESAQRDELRAQLAALDAAVADRKEEITRRLETAELASSIITALREASDTAVGSELDRIEPLLQRIFATVDPHPSFRAVKFLTRNIRGRGRLWTSLHDAEAEVTVEEPALVLSSSQLNVLAVSTFLSLNLAIQTLPMQVVALDDPLQSLDTVNLLGLADLLRRVRTTRQVLVTTHDARLADLLERKLRPVSSGERTRRIDLGAWTPVGPRITQREITSDPRPLRLASA